MEGLSLTFWRNCVIISLMDYELRHCVIFLVSDQLSYGN